MLIIDRTVIISFLDRSLVKFYNTQLHDVKGMSISDYVTSQSFPLEDYHADISESRRFYKKARTKTKINWHKCALRDLTERKSGSVAVKCYEDLSATHMDNINTLSLPLSWQKYVSDYTDSLNNWRNKGDCLLTDFPYIHLSTIKTKEIAFNKEVILNIIDLLEKGIGVISDNSEYQKGVLLQPLEFLFGPFVSVNSPGAQLLSTEANPNKDSLILYNDYRVPQTENYGDLVIRSLIDTSDITEQETNLRSLSTFDVSVFLYIVNYVCENDYATFLSTRTFQNYLSNIVKAIYPNETRPSSRCYAQVRSSLSKLSSLHVKGIRNDEVVRSIDFFDSYQLYEEDKSGQQVVNLTIGSYMYDRIATKKIQHVYAHEVEQIRDRSTQFVYYVFESERQKAYASNRINGELEYQYTFFLHTMRFPSRSTVKKNMDLIDSIFDSFIRYDILLLSYKRLPKGFLVKFKPFLKDDIAKLRLNEPNLIPTIH
jgi:hypothetical protein